MESIGADPNMSDSPYHFTNCIAAYQKRTFGIDVSRYQGMPDWRLVRNAGAQFTYIKLTEGRTHQQPGGLVNWEDAKENGIAVSGYHLANLVHNEQETDAAGGARNFVGMLNKTSGWDMPPALDLELKKLKEHADQYGAAKTLEWIEAWVEEFHHHTKLYPTIYISRHGVKVLGEHHGSLPAYPTWWPDYTSATWGEEPDRGLDCWNTWTFRQFTAAGKVPGVDGDVDLDYFYGDNCVWDSWLEQNSD
jgi:GH25 family lysozyme M1 (1,4-beta-N-acetylmuramidase)